MSQQIKDILLKIHHEKPFILDIINYYPMDLVATGLRSIGAFPIMSNTREEIEELISLARAIVINLGKSSPGFANLCHWICKVANAQNKPIVLDPVGAGISRFRTDTAISFLQNHRIAVVRGYSNELESLLEGQLTIPSNVSIDAIVLENARKLAKKYNVAVVVSGKYNTVIDGNKLDRFNFDSSLLHKAAGIENLLSAIIAAFHAMEPDRFEAARRAIEFYASCVGPASSRAKGPGSLKTELIDKMYKNAIAVIEEVD